MSLDLASIGPNTVHAPLQNWIRLSWLNVVATKEPVPASRFASPLGTFRILYAAEDLTTSLTETLTKGEQASEYGYVHIATLREIGAGEVSATGLSLLDLTGKAAHRLGIRRNRRHGQHASDLTAGQEAAQLLHQQTNLDGIIFNARRGRGRCVAIFDRAWPELALSPLRSLLAIKGLGQHLLDAGLSVRRHRMVTRD